MWVYHSLEGWYVQTSPESITTMFTNATSRKPTMTGLSDTVQFQYKNISNPRVSPQDEIMMALANCKEALMG